MVAKKHNVIKNNVVMLPHLFIIVNTLTLIAQEKVNIAVIGLVSNNIPEGDLGGLSNRLRTELFNTNQYNVFERSRIDELLKEQGFQLTGCTNNECAVEIGKLVGVEKNVLGNIDKVGTIISTDITKLM